jgi:hypothetical protein
MNKIILLYILLLTGTVAWAQEEEVKYDNEEDIAAADKIERTSFTDWKSRTYFSISSSFILDYIVSPLAYTDIVYNDPGGKRIEKAATQTQSQSIYSIGAEVRYNLIDIKNNMAVAISVPAAFGFGQAFQSSDQTIGGSGFGSVQIPVVARLFFGAGSTFKAQDDFGVNIGAGYEFNKLGVFNLNSGLNDPNVNRAWIMPNVMAGISFIRGISPIEVNLKYGFGPIQDQLVDNVGNRLSNKRVTRATSLKITLVYPIN